MTRDALAGSNEIGMALLRQGWEQDYFGNATVHEIGCVGEIQYSERLQGGRYNIMLYGVSRVKILEFVQDKPYRIAKVKMLKDTRLDRERFDEQELSQTFLRLVQNYVSEIGVQRLDELLKLENCSFETILNQVASVLDLSTQEKQSLLEMHSLELRYDQLRHLLQERLHSLKVAQMVKYAPEDPRLN